MSIFRSKDCDIIVSQKHVADHHCHIEINKNGEVNDFVLISNWFQPVEYKASVDEKINVTQRLKFVLGKVENIVGKGENAVYQSAGNSLG